MKDFESFKAKASKDNLLTYRAVFRENYSEMERYCADNNHKKNCTDWIANQINLFEGNEKIIRDLVSLEPIRSNNLNFKVTPTVQKATDFLRKRLIDDSIQTDYDKSESRAVFELVQQIRDNLTHQNKSEIERNQYERNHEILKLGSELTNSIIEKIKTVGNKK